MQTNSIGSLLEGVHITLFHVQILQNKNRDHGDNEDCRHNERQNRLPTGLMHRHDTAWN